MKIYALHGFLGRPSDWDFLSFSDLVTPDLFVSEITPFWTWAQTFNEQVNQDGAEKRMLVGYSLGGRLAMHVILQNPALWDKAVIISAHPGLKRAQERQVRKQKDAVWAERFLHDSWGKVMGDWNAQPVFKEQNHALERYESNYPRKVLSKALDVWSLGNQEDLRRPLGLFSNPIQWIVGGQDKKYSSLLKDLKFTNMLSKISVIPQAGHRVLWESPQNIRDAMHHFYDE